jgi:hypothetical protein
MDGGLSFPDARFRTATSIDRCTTSTFCSERRQKSVKTRTYGFPLKTETAYSPVTGIPSPLQKMMKLQIEEIFYLERIPILRLFLSSTSDQGLM